MNLNLGEICMNVDEICKLIECGRQNGVNELNIDKIAIKFQNIESDFKEEIPYSTVIDEPNLETEPIKEEINLADQAEELALMAIENPSKFEEMLANDDEMLKEFEQSIEE